MLRRRREGSRRAVIALIAAMAAAGALLYVFAVPGAAPLRAPVHLSWWTLAIAFAASEILVIHLPMRRDAHSLSMSELPLVIGLFFASPGSVVLARILGAGSSLAIHRRQRGVKLVFNIAQLGLESGVAVIAFSILASGASSLSTSAWLAAMGAILVTDLFGAMTVTSVIALSEGAFPRKMLRQVLVSGSIAALINTTVGLLAVTTLWRDQAAGWLLVLLGVILYFGYRGYASLTQRYVSLQQLYEFTRSIARSARAENSMRDMLDRVRTLLRAEIAEVTILSGSDAGSAIRITLGPEDAFTTVPLGNVLSSDVRFEQLVGVDRSLLAPRNTRDEQIRRVLTDQQVRDCMVVPLHDNSSIIGTLMAADRLGDVSTFDEEDLRLFETLGNHVSTSLANGRLIDRLRAEAAEKEHQAHHDALTGLANRTLFHKRVHEEIAKAKDGSGLIAVMLMDLDRFKDINDTLGHHNGDVLLQEVGGRLTAALPGEATIARLGGDEFAIVLTCVESPDAAIETAQRVFEALARPFELDQISLDVGASIGIAMCPEHGDAADVLLQRADVAMYAAKAQGKGVELYAPERDQYSPRRLALIGDLRRAIERDELVLHYQPKVDLRSGEVTGAEALVRWRHPTFGFLDPEEFVGLAEHTGLIHQLTTAVLGTALEECSRWRADGFDMGVSVNISARNLLDPALPDEVAALLERTGVEPSALTLELVETIIMGDVARTISVLDRLSGMGVRLSVDDFGTGYSSLSYLKRLPVNEVKIDKSFVFNMKADPNDAAIVTSIIDLGANLGLAVVAEGIEDAETMQHLASMGCNVGQGYFISRPLPAVHLRRWLALRSSQESRRHERPALRAISGTTA